MDYSSVITNNSVSDYISFKKKLRKTTIEKLLLPSILISLFPSFRLDIDISIEILASDSLNIHEKLINAIDSGRLFIYIQKGFHLYHETLLIWIFIVQQNIDILKWLIVTKLNYSKISNIFNNYWIIFNLLYIENLEFKTIYIYNKK